jgi:hypothetical protein
MMPSAHAQARQFGVFRANSGNRYVVAPRDRRSFKPSLCSLWSVFSGNGILTPETRGRKWPRVFHRCLARDQAPTRKPANSGFFAQTREISVRLRLRGGAGRTRTACQARSSIEPVSVAAPIIAGGHIARARRKSPSGESEPAPLPLCGGLSGCLRAQRKRPKL